MSQAVLFKQEGQHIYDYTNVYDPDVDGSNPASSGKIIPAVRSIVIDNRTSDWKIYLVKSVDNATYKCTYVDFPYKTIDRRSMILNYGNDVFMLYYDNRTTPTRLTVDAKMILFGSNIASYRLVKGTKVISYTLIQSTNGSAPTYAVSQIPVVEVTDQYVDGVRRCNTCYTTDVLVDGDVVTLELFDSTGVMIAEVELIARKSTILNSQTAALNPITGFIATANQTIDDSVWYLYKNQDKNNLSIFPEIHFADNTSIVVPVDNNACYLYGFEDVDTTKVGNVYPILVKYYINSAYTVDPSCSSIVAGTRRVLCSEHTLKIIEQPIGTVSKVSVIPVWNANTASYSLRMFAYNRERDGVSDITSLIMNNSAGAGGIKSIALDDGSFSPTLFGTKQNFTIKFSNAVNNENASEYTQAFSIILKHPASVPSTGSGRDRWQIVDPNNDQIVYGIDDATYNRPVVYWDATHGKHYISTEEFPSEEDFIEVFYRLSSPPFDTAAGETEAPYPTHFRFRDVDGNVLTTAISVNAYHRGIVVNNILGNAVEAGTIIMEFLYRVEGTESAILYGVPVLVEPNDNGYVPDSND